MVRMPPLSGMMLGDTNTTVGGSMTNVDTLKEETVSRPASTDLRVIVMETEGPEAGGMMQVSLRQQEHIDHQHRR